MSKLEPPDTAFAGEIDVMTVAGGMISKVIGADCLPSLLRTMMTRDPTVAVKEAGTVALSSNALMNVVAIDVPSMDAVAPGEKFKPVRKIVNAPLPAATNLGVIDRSTGGGGTMVRIAGLDWLPPSLRT
jgi:hypothetical protein